MATGAWCQKGKFTISQKYQMLQFLNIAIRTPVSEGRSSHSLESTKFCCPSIGHWKTDVKRGHFSITQGYQMLQFLKWPLVAGVKSEKFCITQNHEMLLFSQITTEGWSEKVNDPII